MVKIPEINNKSATRNCEVDRVNWCVVIPVLILISMATMACPVSALGGHALPDVEKAKDQLATEVADALEHSQQSIPEQVVSTPEPAQPAESQSSEPPTGSAGTNEYSVSATDFTCICQVDGNVTQELNVNDDQLEVINPGGGVQVYDRITENTYKRSWMGYYILTIDGEDTQVDEERSAVIILTDNGYIMESYQGSDSSPCCVFTFTKTR